MAAKSFKKGDREFSFFGNFWTFAQAYWSPEKNDDYKNGLLRDSNKLWLHFCADEDGKLKDDISSRRMDAIIRAFTCFEEHNFLRDFTAYVDKFSDADSEEMWDEFMKEADRLIALYCEGESWTARKRRKMIVDFLYNVNAELERRRKEKENG